MRARAGAEAGNRTGDGSMYHDSAARRFRFSPSRTCMPDQRTAAATAQLVNLLTASSLRLSADGQRERILLSD